MREFWRRDHLARSCNLQLRDLAYPNQSYKEKAVGINKCSEITLLSSFQVGLPIEKPNKKPQARLFLEAIHGGQLPGVKSRVEKGGE